MLRIPSGKDIRELRKKAGLTQRQLAELTGLSQAVIARIEKGSVDPKVSMLKKITQVLQSKQKSVKTAQDLMTRRVISINHDEPVSKAIDLMVAYGISQLPVLKANKPIGAIEEEHLVNLLSGHLSNPRKFYFKRAEEAISSLFPTVGPDAPIMDLIDLLSRGHNGILVVKDDKIMGIITKIDVLKALAQGVGS